VDECIASFSALTRSRRLNCFTGGNGSRETDLQAHGTKPQPFQRRQQTIAQPFALPLGDSTAVGADE
jgi:hypothetical protein